MSSNSWWKSEEPSESSSALREMGRRRADVLARRAALVAALAGE
ncbi:hypothetical protein [Kitasatospora sp. GAS204B]|nr:hypothetical protein [Kitasatospora sp. GAS204B]MDH6119125.1 hypothetical protein [Kitasatospora sp. GAS204B]